MTESSRESEKLRGPPLDETPKSSSKNPVARVHMPTVGVSTGVVGVVLWVHANFLMPQVMSSVREESKGIVQEYISRHEEFPHRGAFTSSDGDKLESRHESLVKELRGRIAELASANARIEAQLEILIKSKSGVE